MRPVRFALSLAVAVLAACASPDPYGDITVETRANPSYALSELRTYAWLVDTARVRDPDGEWRSDAEDVGATVRSLVDRELRKSGRKEVEQTPDLFVRLELGVDMKATALAVDGKGGAARFESRPRGGIQVVLVDRLTRQDVWAGRALGDVRPRASSERLQHAVREMFADLPAARR